jgi:hypothetical protein
MKPGTQNGFINTPHRKHPRWQLITGVPQMERQEQTTRLWSESYREETSEEEDIAEGVTRDDTELQLWENGNRQRNLVDRQSA